MSSVSELNSTSGCRNNDHNGFIHGDRQEQHYRQQRNGKRMLRKHFERQISDKHLKRRAQIKQSESYDNLDRRYPYQQQYTNTTGSSHLPLQDQQYQNQYHRHRHPDYGGLFSVNNKKRTIFMIVMLLLLLKLAILFIIPTTWYSILLSSSTDKTIKTMPAMIMGLNRNNGQEYDNDKLESHDDGTNRSYQDLADSIRRLRIRRQVLKEETVGEWKERIEEEQLTNNEKIDYNSGNHDEDEVRLKLLEQKIQMEQNKKVRQEFSSSNNSDNDSETKNRKMNANTSHGIEENIAGKSEHRQQNGRHRPDQNKLMSENIAALKLLNGNKNNKSD